MPSSVCCFLKTMCYKKTLRRKIMINLVKDHVYDLPSEFKMVNKDIDRFYKNLIDMRKPFINKIVEEINKKKIN